MEQWYWDSWISSQCNWTQVKRNQSLWEQCAFPGLAWLKELQRLRRVCECFYSLFLFNQLNSTKSTESIYKQIHFSKKILHDFYLYIQILCLWSALCMSNTILTVLLIIFLSAVCLLFYFFLYVAVCVCNSKPAKIFDRMKMWKKKERLLGSFSSMLCRTMRQRSVALRSFNIRDSDLTYLMSYLLS